jgi:hypothetical protein
VEELVVHEVAAEGGIVRVHRRESFVDLIFGVGLARFEHPGQPVEHDEPLAVNGRDLDEPSVTDKDTEYPIGVAAEAGVGDGGFFRSAEGVERLPEALGAQYVGIAVLVDETGAGETGEGLRRPAQIEGGGGSDLGGGSWAGAEDQSGNRAETIVIGQQAEEGGGFGAHGRRPGYWRWGSRARLGGGG